MSGSQAKPRPSHTLPDLSGITLNERYHLVKVVGSGAFGKVYQAVDLVTTSSSSPFVAIKCIRQPEPGSSHWQDRLYQEFDALNFHRTVCSHNNIVTVQNQFTTSSYIFVVMDFCDSDLSVSVKEGRFYNNEELVKDTMVQLIDALQHCHDREVHHQDLKVENILLGPDGQVYLADFGSATRRVVSWGPVMGTRQYMSPEALGIETKYRLFPTAQSDLWSLGIILLILLTGRKPWDQAVSTDDSYANFMRDPEFLYKTLSISEAAHNILLPMFALEPLARTPLFELRKQILAVDSFWKPNMDANEQLPYSPPPPAPSTPPTNVFEPEIQVPDMSAGQGIGKPKIFHKSRTSGKISPRFGRFLKRAAKILIISVN
ncbi:kinase-like domain-containing protein [Mycena floridula]|nr:kinase-like domain-containing protein [Mycena floridula]